jgi:sugar/nucleoside kinase (ribokinase family)
MRIISIGSATVDYIISVPTAQKQKGNKVCFDAGKKYSIETPRMRAGGGALNASISFARAGFSSALASEWGTDATGDFLEQIIRKERIRPHITLTHTDPTATSFIIVSSDGERTILTSRGALKDFSLKDVPARALQSAQFAYVSTGTWSSHTVLRMLRILKKNRVSVMLSPSGHLLSRHHNDLKKIFSLSDIVIMNREEAILATNAPTDDPKKVFKVLDAMVPRIAIMTSGDSGSYASDGVHLFYAPAFRVRSIVDKTGAGDAFGSGFLVGLLELEPRHIYGTPFREESVVYAMHRGAANAASVIGHIGATEGILTTRQFKNNTLWKRCAVKVTRL